MLTNGIHLKTYIALLGYKRTSYFLSDNNDHITDSDGQSMWL